MRRRPDTASAALDESLQADVMRFMAIIAFCLVAIMALARNATPLEAEPAVDAAMPEPPAPIADLPAPEGRAPVAEPGAPEQASPAPAEIVEVPPAAPLTAVAETVEDAVPAPEVTEALMPEPEPEPE
ncbi:MAG: hypothetical protein V2J24_20120, partial [Pseudomonadales bacterium]|nr:hypothetical protein [Pseudomonadales bacterium]